MADARPDTKKSLAQNWMGQFGIKDGEYLSMTKAQLRTQQRPDRPLKVQVWATGMLHTAGYQGEVAMTMRTERKVPLAPNDIIKELYAIAVKYFRDGGIQASDAELEKLRETKETIRRALSALEEDGVCQRTDDQGRLLSDLSDTESRKLGNGKIRLCFFLRPKNATPKTVEQDWRERAVKAQEATVDEIRLLTPPIWKILNIFQIEKPGKATLSNAEFQQRVNHAYESAKKVFLNEIAVDIECPPSAVDTPCPPKVDTPGGTLERNIERNARGSLCRQQAALSATNPACRLHCFIGNWQDENWEQGTPWCRTSWTPWDHARQPISWTCWTAARPVAPSAPACCSTSQRMRPASFPRCAVLWTKRKHQNKSDEGI